MAKALNNTQSSPRKRLATVTTPSRRVVRERLNCRIDPKIKQRAEDAAILLGQDLTAFTESALNEKAQAVMEQEEKLTLSDQDFQKFVAALDSPPAPTSELVAARRALQRLHEAHPEGNW